MVFALAGNQNCGKTTLFNQLTGSNQHVGNFPGVTVDRKDGQIRGHKDAVVVDLPGIYSLSPYTSEEIVTRDFLINERPDGIINIVDATNIERNLYLSMQLLELNIPTVIALNMMDEVRTNGGSIKISDLSESFGVPVVPISASKNEGVDELIEKAVKAASGKILPKRQDFCSGPVHRAIHSITHLVEDHAEKIGVPPRFAATKLVEGDEPMLSKLDLSQNEKETIEHSVYEMEQELDTDREAALADMRYTFIDKVVKKSVVKGEKSKAYERSVAIDKILTHKIFAIPIFVVIMLLVFWLSFSVIGAALSDALSLGIELLSVTVENALTEYGINPVVKSLIIDGIFAGVGSVLSFLPVIVVLFFFLSILEDSGYIARVAFVMDKPLRKTGLSGRSIVPLLIGFGCSVPAVMSSRTLSSERDRKLTILLIPFMSCSAKVPVYAMFTMAFFPNHRALVMAILYFTGIIISILSSVIMRKTVFKGKPVPFVMELPNYRLPSGKSVLMLMWDKAKDFIVKAFTVIFVASLIIWALQTFDSRINVVKDSSDSLLASVGRLIAPIFAPLGFGDWRASTALISGFTAKESVVSTLAVLMGSSTAELPSAMSAMFSPASAMAFLVFTLLYTPCIATISCISKELNKKYAAFVILYQCTVAWGAAFIAFRVASMFIGG